MRKLIERCPGCGSPLVVTRMDCDHCCTGVEGRFQPSPFDRLSPENLAFVELFVRRKGNLKEMERELSVPYSTVRHRLDEVVRELGTPGRPPEAVDPPSPPEVPTPPPVPDAPRAPERRHILDRLERGEISPDEAVRLLEGDRP